MISGVIGEIAGPEALPGFTILRPTAGFSGLPPGDGVLNTGGQIIELHGTEPTRRPSGTVISSRTRRWGLGGKRFRGRRYVSKSSSRDLRRDREVPSSRIDLDA